MAGSLLWMACHVSLTYSQEQRWRCPRNDLEFYIQLLPVGVCAFCYFEVKRTWLRGRVWVWAETNREYGEGRWAGSRGHPCGTLGLTERWLQRSSFAFPTGSLWDCKEKSRALCICIFYVSVCLLVWKWGDNQGNGM